jgi:hypothetical protein
VSVKKKKLISFFFKRLSADILFDYLVSQKSSFSNTRDTREVLLASLDSATASGNALLNTMPIVLAANQSAIVSAWLRNAHLAVPPRAAFDPANMPLSFPDTMLTGVLLKEAYDHSDTVPLVFKVRNCPVCIEVVFLKKNKNEDTKWSYSVVVGPVPILVSFFG